MDPENIQKLQQWVILDNKIVKNKDQIKDIIEQKKEYEKSIIEYVDANKHNNLIINISDGSIKFATRNQSQPISLKFLKIVLDKYSSEKSKINNEELYKFIVDNIEKKSVTTIERKFKDCPE
jgi:hypothetical protein